MNAAHDFINMDAKRGPEEVLAAAEALAREAEEFAADLMNIVEKASGNFRRRARALRSLEKLAAKRLSATKAKTRDAQAGNHEPPPEHMHLLQTRSESSHRLREELFDRMETNRKSRRSGTQEVKRRASNSGISPDGPRRTLTPRGVQSKRTLLKPL